MNRFIIILGIGSGIIATGIYLAISSWGNLWTTSSLQERATPLLGIFVSVLGLGLIALIGWIRNIEKS